MPVPPLRFPLRSFRYSSRGRWLSRCRAAFAVPQLFAAAAAADTVAVLLASSLILPSAAGACSCKVVVFCLLFSLRRFDWHGDAIAFWAEPAWWRSAPRPRPSVPYSLLATNYQLLTTSY